MIAIVWFSLLGYRDLIDPDEGRYAEIPREMISSGDWVTPRLNGFKYFEKPVLQYWMTAISFELFGQNNTAARLWPALIGFLGALFTGFVGWRLYGKASGFYAFIITLTSLLYTAMAHILSLDITVSVFLTIAVGCFTLAQSQRENIEAADNHNHNQQPDQKKYLRNWMLIGWGALAAATLTKGLIGLFLPAAAVVVYSLWQRDWALWKHLHLGKGLILFLALVSPWFIAVANKNPEFLDFFFIHEHFDRYLTDEHSRSGPIWYFIVIVFVGSLPWLGSMLRTIVNPDFSWRPTSYNHFNAERFLWSYAVFIFVFFSLSNSKLASYVLPILPILSLLAAKRIAAVGLSGFDKWCMLGLGLALLVLTWQIERLASERITPEMYTNYKPWIFAAAIAMLAAAFFMFKTKNTAPNKQQMHIVTSSLMVLIAYQSLSWGYQSLTGARSYHLLAEAIKEKAPNYSEIFCVDSYYPHSLSFYLNSKLKLVQYKGELEMGITQEPQLWIESTHDFLKLWENEKQPVAVMSHRVYEIYKSDVKLPMQTIFQGARLVAVTKPKLSLLSSKEEAIREDIKGTP